MTTKLILVAVLCVIASAVLSVDPPPPYTTKYYTQLLDHFNQQTVGTYKQRYLYADKYWGTKPYPNGCKGPIFFYTGNESPVTDYYTASGLFTQVLAPKYGGLLIFAEHRYFGESLPFGNSSFTREHIGYLSADQALADYATLIPHLKETIPGAAKCPVVAFGGSYGGMLTTWFRIKYPQLTIGGLAGSAPFAFAGTGISPYAFTNSATDTYRQAAPGCDSAIKEVLQTLQTLAKTEDGRATIVQKMKLCDPLKDEAAALAVADWVSGGLIDQAMLDYPYPTDYGVKLPGWPVNVTCDRIMKTSDPLDSLGYAIGTIYNDTGSYKCYNPASDVPDFASGVAWPYLACTQVFLPSGSSGMFPYAAYDPAASIASCKEQFGVTLDPNWSRIHWGGFEALKSAENIIFSNGMLDPWHSSGVLKTIKPSLPAIVIPEAAHHLDLRGPDPADPIYVQQAREQEDKIIGGWIADYFGNSN